MPCRSESRHASAGGGQACKQSSCLFWSTPLFVLLGGQIILQPLDRLKAKSKKQLLAACAAPRMHLDATYHRTIAASEAWARSAAGMASSACDQINRDSLAPVGSVAALGSQDRPLSNKLGVGKSNPQTNSLKPPARLYSHFVGAAPAEGPHRPKGSQIVT